MVAYTQTDSPGVAQARAKYDYDYYYTRLTASFPGQPG